MKNGKLVNDKGEDSDVEARLMQIRHLGRKLNSLNNGPPFQPRCLISINRASTSLSSPVSLKKSFPFLIPSPLKVSVALGLRPNNGQL